MRHFEAGEISFILTRTVLISFSYFLIFFFAIILVLTLLSSIENSKEITMRAIFIHSNNNNKRDHKMNYEGYTLQLH